MTGPPAEKGKKNLADRKNLRLLLWLPVPVLLYWALRGASFREITLALGRLRPGRLALLLALNLAFTSALALRWIWILHGLGEKVSLRSMFGLAAARLAGFSVSYLTPGPQFGGEPLQLFLAQRWTGLAYTRGSASLLIDRSMELAGNFAFIGLSLSALGSMAGLSLPSGFPSFIGPALLSAGLLLALVPLGYLAATFAGFRPLSALADKLPKRMRAGCRASGITAFILAAETEVAAYGKRPALAFAQFLLSFIAVQGLAVLELWLTLRYLDAKLAFDRTALVLAAGKVALYLPVPGGLGVLEATQRSLLSLLGYGPGKALALSAYVRLRDLFFTLGGLLATAIGLRAPNGGGRRK